MAAPRAVGVWQDDAIYVVTAKALAEGSGYRHIELPEAPYQTKYPILYPALLVPGFWISTYPQNLPMLLAPTALAAALLIGLSLLYWRRIWGASRAYSLGIGAVAAASPVIVEFVRYTMSDLVYGAVTVAALYCVDAVALDDTRDARERRIGIAGAGALMALAVLTRSIGVTLVVSTVALALYRRQVRAAVAVGAPALVALSGWWGWQIMAGAANRSAQPAFLAAPDLSYAMWIPTSAGEILRVIAQNLFRSAEAIGADHLALPARFVSEALASPSGSTVLLQVLCYSAVLLVLAGFVSTLRLRLGAIHVYAVLYAAFVLAWPFDPGRFLVPWTPFILYFLFEGVRLVARRRGQVLVAGVLVLAFAAEDWKILESDDENYYLRELDPGLDLRERRQVERWIRENIAASRVIASPIPAGIYLETGRSGYFLWPDHDPHSLYYGTDRRWTQLYARHSRSEALWLLAEMRQGLETAYREAEIDYIVENDYQLEALVLAKLRPLDPFGFEPAFESSGSSMRVYAHRPQGR